MLRRLHSDQPEKFAFTPANLNWAKGQIAKYPEDRQRSAVIALMWRAQEQEGWLSRPAIETVADMLGMEYIRALEVATFYFMFQLKPVGSIAHVQVCGTLSCMICGGESLVEICKDMIAPEPHMLSPDGRFSWEEVECLGACANAPMVQIGKDYYEDLTPKILRDILAAFARGEVPVPGPQNGRYAAEPLSGPTVLASGEGERAEHNASVELACARGDTVARITGDAPTSGKAVQAASEPKAMVPDGGVKPPSLDAPHGGRADDLKAISGVGPALEKQLNELGIWHFAQVAAWSDAEVAWIDDNLVRFKGRASRENWVEQARKLAIGGET
ncbi:MAG: NADH-quinone oxidoreductase subunit NuoE [Paracoccaceae bacterium]